MTKPTNDPWQESRLPGEIQPQRIPHARFVRGSDGLARAQSFPTEPSPAPVPDPDPITVGFPVTIKLARRGKHITAATIKTVGRKWVTLATGGLEYRFARPTAPYPAVIALDGNGYPSPGDVVLNAAQLASDRARGAAWRDFLEALKATPHVPDSVSLEAIAAARKALGL